MKNLKILLVRHAESDANKGGYIAGSRDCLLTEKGKLQANALGYKLWLNKIKLDAVYSSTLTRAKDTAEYIRKYQEIDARANNIYTLDHKLQSVIENPKMQEMCFGEAEGKFLKDLPDCLSIPWINLGYPQNVPGQETKEEVVKRAIEGITEIAENEKGSEKICIVTHGMLIRLLQLYYKGKVEDVIPNTGYLEIEYDYDNKKIIF